MPKTTGDLILGTGDLVIPTGDVIVTEGDVSVTEGDLSVAAGRISAAKINVTAHTPTTAQGSAGDRAGDIAIDGAFLYYCTEDYGEPTVYTIWSGFDATVIPYDYLTFTSSEAFNQNWPLPPTDLTGWTITRDALTLTVTGPLESTGVDSYKIPVDAEFNQASGEYTLTSSNKIWSRVAMAPW